MRIALITDIHANREAFEACLEQAELHGVDRYAFLGDFVGYGPDPDWVVEKAMELIGQGRAVAVKGNHDEGAVQGARPTMVDDARQVLEWTHDQLTSDQLMFLDELPYTVEEHDCLFVHANAFDPPEWEYVSSRMTAVRSMQATMRTFSFAGHVHAPKLYHLSNMGKVFEFVPMPGVAVPVAAPRHWMTLPGSCGQPRDGNPAAAWALLDLSRMTLTFHRVPYDHEVTANKILQAGLPERFAYRLCAGL